MHTPPPHTQVRFLPSGGDTTLQTEQWISQQVMNAKSELMQTLMMAASESNFFGSAPVFVHQVRRSYATLRFATLRYVT